MSDKIHKYYYKGSTLFRIHFGMEGFRIRKQGFKTRKEAQNCIDHIRYLITAGTYQDWLLEEEDRKRVEKKIKVSDVANKCLLKPRAVDLAPKTLVLYKSVYKNWVGPMLGKVDIRMITDADIEAIYTAQHNKGRAMTTQNAPVLCLVYLMKRAIALGWMDENQRPKIRWRRGKARQSFLTKEEIKNLIETANNWPQQKLKWLACYIATQFYTATRSSETRALMWSDIDWKNRTINISKSLGVGGRIQYATKNMITDSKFPIHDELMPFLREQRMRTGQCKYIFQKAYFYNVLDESKNKGGRELGPIVTHQSINLMIKRAAKAAGIEQSVSTHTLRKSACDIALRDGATILQVAHLSRTTPENILKSYSHLDLDVFREKMATIKILKNDKETTTANDDHLDDIEKS